MAPDRIPRRAPATSQHKQHRIADYGSGAYGYIDFVTKLFAVQPIAALDEFLAESDPEGVASFPTRFSYRNKQPINVVKGDVLIKWAQSDPDLRFLRLAECVELFARNDDKILIWSPLALEILEKAPDRAKVLEEIASRLHPNSWSGSRADLLDERRRTVQTLFGHTDPLVSAWARAQDQALAEDAARDRANERRTDESFE